MWVLNDKSGVKALGFEETSNKLVNESVGGSWGAAVNFVLLALFFKELSGFLSGEVFRKGFTEFLFKFFHH